jgi:hypothetical protein
MSCSFRFLAIRLVALVLLLGATDIVNAAPIALSTPAGVNDGDKFRFLFFTGTTTTQATSTDIATYNAFVNTAAGGATYFGSTVNWYAIGSTASVNARTNVGGFESAVPVYLATGTKIADDMGTGTGGLWSGNILAPANYDINGTPYYGLASNSFTGSRNDGTNIYPTTLGGVSGANIGASSINTGGKWLFVTTTSLTERLGMYGLSEELTAGGAVAVPEIDPAGMGSVLALVTGTLGLLERRRQKAKLA